MFQIYSLCLVAGLAKDRGPRVSNKEPSMNKNMNLFFAGLLCFGLACCRADKGPAKTAPASAAVNLIATQWNLEELNGRPVIADSRATLAFPEAGKVAGNGSCNRFTGTAEINGNALKFGPLASTRMMCEGEASRQEADYFSALDAARRFEVKDGKLHIYGNGTEKPLIFRPAS